MLTKRIVANLTVTHQRDAQLASLARTFNQYGADEILFLYPTDDKKEFLRKLQIVADEIVIPLTVGGIIDGLDDFRQVLSRGADKVLLGQVALDNPQLVEEASRLYGAQAVVVSVPVVHVEDSLMVKDARELEDFLTLPAMIWAKKLAYHGAGEIIFLPTDMPAFPEETLTYLSTAVTLPILVPHPNPTAENLEHLLKTFPGIDGILLPPEFQSGPQLTQLNSDLAARGLPIRTL